MNRHDGRVFRRDIDEEYDVVVAGSGPAGAAAAAVAAEAGARVAIVEEGAWYEPDGLPDDIASAFAAHYRGNGMTSFVGSPPTPYLQGRVVGGGSVINGAISWRLPEDVFAAWLRSDPGLEVSLTWQDVLRSLDRVEERLCIAPTPPDVAGPRNLLMARGAEALGLEHRPISRNVVDCAGSGLCIQGCREGAKLSMDVTYIADAEKHGAAVYSSVRVDAVRVSRGAARAVEGVSRSGHRVRLGARHAVVLAASAVQTPALLIRSGIRHGPVGRHFQCHPGVSVSGRFAEPVHAWRGATQGHEVIGLRHEGLKFESLAMDLSVLGMRMPGAGGAFLENLSRSRHHLDWGAAVKSSAHGRVRVVNGNPVVTWSPSRRDVLLFRRGAAVLGKMFLGAGASAVYLHVHGWEQPVSDPNELERFARRGPTRASAYPFAATHLFGSCRMGSAPGTSVVGPDFRHHAVDGLYVADSSVFPTNIGVNPQTSILALARLCGESIVKRPVTGARRRKTPMKRNALELEDLLAMTPVQVAEVFHNGHDVDPQALDDTQYRGIDLTLPAFMHKILWQTFRKTFYRDPLSGVLRGWNVRMEQTGWDGPGVPKKKKGEAVTFGHYHVVSAAGIRFPRGWTGATCLDYSVAGNKRLDVARFTYSPLVAVNEGRHDLLLGWEVFRLGSRNVSFPSYWALRLEGPLEEVVPVPT